jgi:alcohol dehydrogenase
MRQLTFMDAGRLEWLDVPEPRLESPLQALVRPVMASVCDYDYFLVRGASTLPGPIALGHECIARVLSVGEEVRAVRPGDLAIVPYHISCGTCGNCRRGYTGRCASVPPASTFGFGAATGSWGGLYSDIVRVPYADGMLVPVPAGLAAERVAGCGDNVTVAWCAVASTLRKNQDTTVFVVGGGMASTGLFAAAASVSLGATRVVYLDSDPDRLARATRLGATAIEGSLDDRYGPYGLSIDASMTSEGLACALRSTEPEQICHTVCLHFHPVSIPFLEMYTNRLTLKVGGIEHVRPAIPSVLDQVVTGRLRPEIVTSKTAAWDDAIDALMEGTASKLILTRNEV